ncbi:MAG: Hsp20/alpha crystallin family protein [Cyanomargarita calcarea GSE-NOS-MK-12-04C]|jgi:HSP20 family protein|uniref:Hsp20/alpha crystallin family protein n=1 Tax=Cyanomargarita calcarea GSE-NOS-MK-12-04C TaxID=2839659 RepID=A0A951QPG3_9CYAN|nr:Hsp20/alpha crystallin family protein [Cyanomargarita calcarea GSE-NOS-MK-12-04C]
MSLIPWQPLKELDTLRQQMNHLFDEFTHGTGTYSLFRKLGNVTNLPAIELKETDNDLILQAQVPGMEAKDLDIQVSENTVSIVGEYKEEKTGESQGVFHSEFSYGEFKRIVPLPVNIKQEQVKAKFKDGVITLTLPKADTIKRNAVKVDLTVQEQAREAMTKERLHIEHIRETMHQRAAEELDTHNDTEVSEEARVTMIDC